VLAAMIRGFAVGLGVLLITVWFAKLSFVAPLWILVFALLGAAILGTMGLLAGIWAEKFDQLAAFQNFLIVPATFLAGVFYSVHSLPPFWQAVSHANPFFYMIDGFRYGLWLFRPFRCAAGNQPGDRDAVLRHAVRDRDHAVKTRLQAAPLIHGIFEQRLNRAAHS